MTRALLIPSPGLKEPDRLICTFPTGLYCLKQACRSAGYDVEVLGLFGDFENRAYHTLEQLADAMLSLFDPGAFSIIGLSTMGGTFPLTIHLAEKIKRFNPKGVVVLGGPHASFVSSEVLAAFDFVDAVVVGEGELTFPEMMRRFRNSADDWRGVPGVRVRDSAYVDRPLIRELDGLPVIDFSEKRRGYFRGTDDDQNELEGVRGCYARCKFCATTRFWQNRVRRKSSQRLIEEMAQLAESSGLRVFNIIGDNFTSPTAEFQSFCKEMIHREAMLKWKCSCRIGDLRPEDLALMKAAGCRSIFVGVESASQKTLDRLNKKIDRDCTLEMIRLASDIGIEIVASHIVGFPWETETDVMNTLKQHTELLRAGVQSSMVNPLYPLAGAEGFPQACLITDVDKVEPFLPRLFNGPYTKNLIDRYPGLFSQFGYYDTPNMSRNFVMDAVATSRHVLRILASG